MNILGSNIELAEKCEKIIIEKKSGKGAGVSAAIMIDDELVVSCAVGTRGLDGTEADVSDLYNIGSVFKVYCAVAIMKLVEMGKVNLDAPVIKYLPRFKMRDERYKYITVRMTLNHSSGLPGSNYRNAIANKWSGDNIMEENYEYLSYGKLKANPGAFSTYCNDGFEIAAAIVEEVSGKSYIKFLRQYITTPAGALSTGQADVGIDNRRMMSCIGKKPEWLSAIGAGAIRTDISDCARFGHIFIKPHGIMKKEYLDEICKPQGITFLGNDSLAPVYGLGWDTVEFRNPMVDLGKGTLQKSGGTSQFVSYLIVSPQYKLSAAISGTVDCKIDFVELLCNLIKEAMNDRGTDVTPKLISIPVQINQIQKAPQNILEKNGCIYYSAGSIYKLEIKDDKLTLLHYVWEGEWERDSWLPEMQWDGEKFYSGENCILFEHHDGKEYLILFDGNVSFFPLAQKNVEYFPMSEGWEKRIGKKYIACNVSAYGTCSLFATAIVVDKLGDDGVILFVIPNDEYIIPAISYGDDDTNMFLSIPGFRSRDIYAPFAFKRNGVEYLRNGGYIYIDCDAVPELKTGNVTSLKKEQNAIFKTKAGTTLEFTKPNDVAVIMFNNQLSMVYNSNNDEVMTDLCDGYIIFANDGPMDFKCILYDFTI